MQESDVFCLQFDALCPILHLYRHGQIQQHDPVFLPQIPQADLPSILHRANHLGNRLNAWSLGNTVASGLLHDLSEGQPVGSGGKHSSETEQLIVAIKIMTSYIVSGGSLRQNPFQ